MRRLLKTVLVMQFLVWVAVILDVPIAREIITSIYLATVPGLLILKVLRLHKMNFVDTVLLSVGLSIAFLMFVGLLMNKLLPFLGISRPLSTVPLMLATGVFVLALMYTSFKQDSTGEKKTNLLKTKLNSISYKTLFLSLIPILGIIGSLYANTFILILMIIAIATLYAFSVSSEKKTLTRLYPLIVLTISIALLFHTSFVSRHLLGYDVHGEYYVFKLTELKGNWHPPEKIVYPPDEWQLQLFHRDVSNLRSVLSTTILPTVFSTLSDIEGELIFKVIFPLLFCLVPLALYRIYELQIGKSVAILSVFFFISSPIVFWGVEPISLTRQMIAELFLALSLFLLVDKRLDPRKRQMLFMIFGAALVVSHYSIAFIFLFYIVLTFIFLYRKADRKMLNETAVLLFIVMVFSWHMYVSYAPSETLVNNIQVMYEKFVVDFLKTEARVSQRFFSTHTSIFVDLFDRILFYVRHLFIVIGITKLAIKPKETKFDSKYRLMSVLSMFIMLLCFIVPHFASALNLTRFYHIVLLFLSPFFVLGGMTFSSWIRKMVGFLHRKSRNDSWRKLELRMISIVLIASFLFQVGLVNHILGDVPVFASPLDIGRLKATNDPFLKTSLYNVYTPEQEISSVVWLSREMNETSVVYADLRARVLLICYGLIPTDQTSLLYSGTTLDQGAYVYLRTVNTVDGLVWTFRKEIIGFNEILPLLNENNKVYSNGDSEVYYAP